MLTNRCCRHDRTMVAVALPRMAICRGLLPSRLASATGVFQHHWTCQGKTGTAASYLRLIQGDGGRDLANASEASSARTSRANPGLNEFRARDDGTGRPHHPPLPPRPINTDTILPPRIHATEAAITVIDTPLVASPAGHSSYISRAHKLL